MVYINFYGFQSLAGIDVLLQMLTDTNAFIAKQGQLHWSWFHKISCWGLTLAVFEISIPILGTLICEYPNIFSLSKIKTIK